jgi:predicted PurR-regulated permease PerM
VTTISPPGAPPSPTPPGAPQPQPRTDRAPERVILIRPRTVLQVAAIALVVYVLFSLAIDVRRVLTWILIAVFLAIALNPAVDALVRRGWRRGLSVAVVGLAALAVIAGFLALLIPPLIDQARDFADALPGLVDDLTRSRGPLGFLERDYHVVESVRDALRSGGAEKAFGLTSSAISIAQSVIEIVVGTITVTVLTIFMLLEGPRWVEMGYEAVPERVRPRWRHAGAAIYRTVGGYITGNLLISLIAGLSSALALFVLGVPYAVPLGLLVAILDLIPLAGATIAAIVVSLVAFSQGLVPGLVVVAFFVVYQQIENHFLQPLVYGRTVQMSPLAVLIAVLIGAEAAGVLGALAAIPVGASIGIVVREIREHRAQVRARALAP